MRPLPKAGEVWTFDQQLTLLFLEDVRPYGNTLCLCLWCDYWIWDQGIAQGYGVGNTWGSQWTRLS